MSEIYRNRTRIYYLQLMQLLKNIIKKYFSSFTYFYRYLGYRLFVFIALSILVGILDGFGLTMFLPLLQMVGGSDSVATEDLGKLSFFIDGLKANGIALTLNIVLLILLIFFVLKGIISYLSLVYKVKITQHFVTKMRIKLINLFVKYSFKSFVTADVGKIQNALTGEVARVSLAFNFYASCFQQLLMTLVYMSFVFLIDWKFALLVTIGGLITNVVYKTIFKITKKQSSELTKHNNDFQGLVIQFVANFKYLKATGYLAKYKNRLQDTVLRIESNLTKMGVLSSVITATREPLLIGVVCTVILIQVHYLNGQLAGILISLLFFYRALAMLMSFQNSYNTFIAYSGSLENIEAFEQELKIGTEKNGNTTLNKFNDTIEFQNVFFGFSAKVKTIKDVNLVIKKNKTVAFVGESGSGKTTMVNLITGLLKSNEGTITIDGIEIEKLDSNSYQSRIGFITQEPVIFNDTIFNNVTLWAGDNSENRKRFHRAITLASLFGFLEELPKKENTLLGNNGINLSGGQKQRISIARELYKDIDILVLDEATSALDSETEKEIQNNIEELKGKYTIIIIAHRLSTIKKADVIYLIDKGKIVDFGNFENLLSSSERFRKMVEIQEI